VNREQLAEPVRQSLVRYPEPFSNHYGVVPGPPPAGGVDLGDVRDRLAAAGEALASIEALAAALSDAWLVNRVLARREAVTSSAIEGTQSTLDELLAAEETDDDGGRRRTVQRQVIDYARTLERVLPEAARLGTAIFDLDLVRRLHRDVMAVDADYVDEPGELRTRVVWIGGGRDIAYSTFNPPPPDRVPGCLAETIAYMRGGDVHAMAQNLIARMATAHAHFEAVHPFRDGNGRTGRLLLAVMMAAGGRMPLFLSPYIEAHRPAYFDALRRAQQRLEWSAAIGFLADAVAGTVVELRDTRDALLRLRSIWRDRRRHRAGSSALRALDLLTDYPVVTVKRLAERLGVTFPAAAAAVSQLEAAGILAERTGYRQHRLFVATEVLGVLNRPFGHPPVLPER